MNIVIPSSRNKRYLSGFDWVMGVIDCILRNATCAGNSSQIVFILNAGIEEAVFRNHLSQFIKQFPVLQGRIARDYNLAPYWRIPRKRIENCLNLNVYHLEDSSINGDFMALVEKCVNKPFKTKNDHLAFHLIYTKKRKSFLVITFDHLLFDARGAELFVNLFQQYLVGGNGSGIAKDIHFTAPSGLSQWKEKFYAGQRVNRKIIALSQTSMRTLPLPHSDKKKGFKFKLISFNQQETKKIYNRAYDEAGYLMEMPYLLAVATQTMHKLFEKRGVAADSYIVPLSVDKRTNKDIKQEIFFNYASMFLFQIGVETLGDKKLLIKSIKEQMYEQVQSRLPENIWKAASLLRIAPFSVLKKVFHIPFNGRLASFWFSHVGRCSYQFPELLDVKIKNAFHMPRVPVPPGLGIFFNSFDGQLNATITWIDGLLSAEEVSLLENGLRNRL